MKRIAQQLIDKCEDCPLTIFELLLFNNNENSELENQIVTLLKDTFREFEHCDSYEDCEMIWYESIENFKIDFDSMVIETVLEYANKEVCIKLERQLNLAIYIYSKYQNQFVEEMSTYLNNYAANE
jgi:hypothetical protein